MSSDPFRDDTARDVPGGFVRELLAGVSSLSSPVASSPHLQADALGLAMPGVPDEPARSCPFLRARLRLFPAYRGRGVNAPEKSSAHVPPRTQGTVAGVEQEMDQWPRQSGRKGRFRASGGERLENRQQIIE